MNFILSKIRVCRFVIGAYSLLKKRSKHIFVEDKLTPSHKCIKCISNLEQTVLTTSKGSYYW